MARNHWIGLIAIVVNIIGVISFGINLWTIIALIVSLGIYGVERVTRRLR